MWGEIENKFKDPKLNFEEEDHIYSYDGQEYQSVTSFLKQWFPFDKIGIATNVARRRRCSVDQVLQEWDQKADFGTYIHKLTERYILQEDLTNQEEFQIKHSIEYLKKKNFAFMMPEVIIWSQFFRLAGTIDLLAFDHEGNAWIIDWKTSNNITKAGDSCAAPIEHLNNGNFYSYSMQLNVYKFILENEFQVPVKNLKIVKLLPNKTFLEIEAEDLQKEVEDLLF